MATWVKKADQAAGFVAEEVEARVRAMLAEIAAEGDAAIARHARELDDFEGGDFRVGEDEIRAAERALPASFKEDFADSLRRVRAFAERQRDSMQGFEVEIEPGITLGQKIIPIGRVGCYIPGGKYPLIASAMMSIATADVAGVGEIVACAPPNRATGRIYAHSLYAMHAAGADAIYTLGGVQAMAAMAHGLCGIAPVDMIVGAGNPYVAEAKRQLFGVVGIDLLAGPTEIGIIADESADPALVATDLLGQAEHGPDSPAWLVTTSERLGRAVLAEVERQLETLPTREVASVSWGRLGEIRVVEDDDAAVAAMDAYAPEHLELMTAKDDWYLERLRNYGSAFVGEESTVAYGDKGVGTNHTLPTGRAARYTGGLWAGKFLKTVTWQRLTPEASRRIAPPMARICEAEGMLAHKITADVRARRYD